MNSRVTPFAALVLLPAALFAQDSSSKINPTPFRRGQWAAQFQVGSSTSLGFVKFRSPTRALVLDLRLTGGHTETNVSDSSGTRFAGVISDAMTQIRFGWRRYRAGTTKLVSHCTEPLSDQRIADLLHEKGLRIARRTVAKYREQLGLLPARFRRRVA